VRVVQEHRGEYPPLPVNRARRRRVRRLGGARDAAGGPQGAARQDRAADAGERFFWRGFLRLKGIEVGRRHAGTVMRRMGIQAPYRRPNTIKKHPAHPVFPYLLRGLALERANHVWALDTRYIPMARGWVYLVAVLSLTTAPSSLLEVPTH